MRRLWGRMAAMYGGSRWASATSTLACDEQGCLTLAADTWAQALTGISDAQIGEGLRACLASIDDYVPTPMLFRARCLGIPPLAFVRLALRDARLIKPTAFTRLVWSLIDSYALAKADQQRAERIVEDAYDLACEHVMRGGTLPDEPQGAIEAPQAAPRTPASASTVAESMDHIARSLGLAVADGAEA